MKHQSLGLPFSVLVALCLLSPAVSANDGRAFDEAPKHALSGPLLIVTHAETRWDREKNAKPGIDAVISSFESAPRATVVFLAEASYEQDADGTYHDRRTPSWYTKLAKPTWNLMSHGGEHRLLVESPEVVLVGGNFGQCQTTTMLNLIEGYRGNQPLVIRMPVSAIFSGLGGFATTLAQDREALGEESFKRRIVGELDSFSGSFDKAGVTASVIYRGQTLGEIGNGARSVRIIFE